MLFGLFGKKEKMEEIFVGKVVHYFPKVKAAVIGIEKNSLSVGDRIKIKGYSGEFDQEVKSMQVEHETVEQASVGGEVAIKVRKKARRGNRVFLLRKKIK